MTEQACTHPIHLPRLNLGAVRDLALKAEILAHPGSSPDILVTSGQGLDLLAPFYSHLLGFPCGSDGEESACNAGDLGVIPWLGRFPGEGHPLQYSGLENSMDCVVHGVAKSWT